MALDPNDLRLLRMRLSRVRRQMGDYTGFFLLWDEEMDEDISFVVSILDQILEGDSACQLDV